MSSELVKPFAWQMAKHNGGGIVLVTEMKSKHLFYTWLMIWNHAAPEGLRIWDTHRYVFGSFYTKEYMLEAFRCMYIELKNRNDLGPKMVSVIKVIETIFRRSWLELPGQKELETKQNDAGVLLSE